MIKAIGARERVSAAPTPKAAVFLSYAAAQEFAIFDIAERISRNGISVFLSQASDRDDWDRHVHNALSFADEVLVVISPFRTDLLNPDALPGFPNGHLVWLAIGSAWTRGIPIKGLLKGINRAEVVDQSAIPRSIRRGPLFNSVEECADDLLGWLPEERPMPILGLSCQVCICREDGTPAVFKLKEQLASAGFGVEEWVRPAPNLDRYDAAIVIPGSAPRDYWKRFALSLVRDFVKSKKPVALLALSGDPEQPELAELLPATARVEYQESDISTFLQIVWTIVGYQQYDFGTPILEKPILERTEQAQSAISGPQGAVFICYAHTDNQSQDPKQRWLDRLLEFLQPLVRQQALTIWSDEDIKIGDQWHERIRSQLEISRAVVLLVSPGFLASEYIANSELPVLLKNASDRGATVLPVIISPCLYEEAVFKYPDAKLGPNLLKLSSLQSANPPSRTLIDMNEAEQNRVFLRLARRLQEMALGFEETGGQG
jgi:TIR domain